jgi:hypothetical protein
MNANITYFILPELRKFKGITVYLENNISVTYLTDKPLNQINSEQEKAINFALTYKL